MFFHVFRLQSQRSQLSDNGILSRVWQAFKQSKLPLSAPLFAEVILAFNKPAVYGVLKPDIRAPLFLPPVASLVLTISH